MALGLSVHKATISAKVVKESLRRELGARAAGANADADISKVRSFLLSRLNDPSPQPGGDREPQSSEIRLEALETLGILGDLRDDHLTDIYAHHKSFSFYEQIELARLLLKLSTWHAQGTVLRNALLSRCISQVERQP